MQSCVYNHAPVEAKIKALSSIFPDKIEFDGKNFRTDNLNKVLDLIYQQTNELRGLNKKSEESFSTFPATVPGAGVAKWVLWQICEIKLKFAKH